MGQAEALEAIERLVLFCLQRKEKIWKNCLKQLLVLMLAAK